MRLNRVESFYAFLLRFRSERSEERGRPTIVRPSARVTATVRPLQGWPQVARVASKGGRPWPAHKGRCSPASRPQGQHPPSRAVPSEGSGACRTGNH
ncbi:hypothetical protein GW17_00053628 [Ensete ventricosum]|nr:hypothetical protein GW17_00053628 [Ensete ventricosum]